MSKIEELILQLCPCGVEFKELRVVAIIKRGERVTKAQLNNEGKYPVISGGIKPLGLLNKSNREKDTITICQYGTAGYIDWQGFPFWANDICYSIFPGEDLNNRFLFFYLKSNQEYIYSLKTNAIPAHLPQNSLNSISIPVPPLPIQQEIVNILDKFTALEAELEARKKQYEYYRNQLFNFDDKDVKWKTMDEIGTFIRGKRFVKDDMIAEGFPCIHYGELYTHYKISADRTKSFIDPNLAAKLRIAHTGDVIIVSAGETIEDIGNSVAWLGKSDVVIHDACFSFSHKQNPKYISYFLQTNLFRSQIKRNISSGKISSINAAGLGKAKIPVPSILDQERIVNILDKFDALVNNISIGLPAEIKTRRKQYEYYRGKLLDFKNISNG